MNSYLNSKNRKNNLKVSIITTTYNSALTVRDTLESVNAQTYSHIEHIIVDGNSKDNTLEIVKKNTAKEFQSLSPNPIKAFMMQ